jgi:hypothetical protein
VRHSPRVFIETRDHIVDERRSERERELAVATPDDSDPPSWFAHGGQAGLWAT